MTDQLMLDIKLRNEVKKTAPHIYGGGFVYIPRILELIAEGANINALEDSKTATDDSTPLVIAVRSKHAEVTQVLLDAGADTEIQCDFGTPLMMASQSGCFDIVQMLVEKKAQVNAQSRTQTTALMNAARSGHIEIVDYLISNGADTEMQNEHGDTALMIARSNGQVEAALVLQYAADKIAEQKRKAEVSAVARNMGVKKDLPVKHGLVRLRRPGI